MRQEKVGERRNSNENVSNDTLLRIDAPPLNSGKC